MKISSLRISIVLAVVAGMLAGCERPPVNTEQRGYRGTAMVEVNNPRAMQVKMQANQMPADLPPAETGGPSAATVYKNVQVLKDLNVGQFTRLMVEMTNWVAPNEGCAYCHSGADFASDTLYTKVVARRMLQMTRHINSDWKNHVAGTGVTCFTCHRGEHIPANVWFGDAGFHAKGMSGNKAGQNTPAQQVGLTSLPFDPFTPFLQHKAEIRAVSTTALPTGNLHNIKETEATYGLMMHFSKALGVNCTYCHNSRSFSAWDASTPQRATAWYGIRMVRDLNGSFLEPLTKTFPPARLGPQGDVAKVNCATCHNGAYKPLYGANMLSAHPELATVAAAEPVAAQPQAAKKAR